MRMTRNSMHKIIYIVKIPICTQAKNDKTTKSKLRGGYVRQAPIS